MTARPPETVMHLRTQSSEMNNLTIIQTVNNKRNQSSGIIPVMRMKDSLKVRFLSERHRGRVIKQCDVLDVSDTLQLGGPASCIERVSRQRADSGLSDCP